MAASPPEEKADERGTEGDVRDRFNVAICVNCRDTAVFPLPGSILLVGTVALEREGVSTSKQRKE